MRHLTRTACLAFAAALIAAVPGLTEFGPTSASAQEAKRPATAPAISKRPIAFRPPLRGAPSRRVGGATRRQSAAVGMRVAAPETLAYAATSSPTFYWQMDRPAPRVVVTVIADDAIDPLIEVDLGPMPSGVHAYDMGAGREQLAAGVDYEWSVAVVVNPRARSEDIVSSARIRYVPPGPDPTDVQALAAAGYWYDLTELLLGDAPQTAPQPNREAFVELARNVGLAWRAP